MKKLIPKTPQEIIIMKQGGAILHDIKNQLLDHVTQGVNAKEIDDLATSLIASKGAEASFKKVPGYKWATCININDGLVHGIPKKDIVFRTGDVVSVDVGVYFKGFHTDTSATVLIGADKEKQKFLEAGKLALKNAIEQAQSGNKIGAISHAMEQTLKDAGYAPIKALTGHGVGRELHEDPYIPCYVSRMKDLSYDIIPGLTLAIEVMYTMGGSDIALDTDGWTIRTKDGKISALFEETVAVENSGPIILT
jgi:methionyl aminopeptidase